MAAVAAKKKKKKVDENVTAGISWDFPSRRQDDSTWNHLAQGIWAILWHSYPTSVSSFYRLFVVDIFVH